MARWELLRHHIFERDAFRMVHLKPRLGYCILVREDFKVVIIANLLVSIDIDQDGY
jgi:hypothetical protein